MPKAVHEYRCLLISPSDLESDRIAIVNFASRWNAQTGRSLNSRLEIVRWETHSVPDLAGEPQTVLNHQIVDDCDFAIALFWTRLGQPTSKYQSGSAEEIERLLNSNRQVMVFFNSSAIPQERFDPKQYEALTAYKQSMLKRGIVGVYSNTNELIDKIANHITSKIAGLAQDKVEPVSAISKPDIRLRVGPAIAKPDNGTKVIDVCVIHIQNHSNMTVYLNHVSIELTTGYRIVPLIDSLTKQRQTRRTLNPGESFSFNLTHDVFDGVDPATISKATIVDDIGRKYESTVEEMAKAAKAAFWRS